MRKNNEEKTPKYKGLWTLWTNKKFKTWANSYCFPIHVPVSLKGWIYAVLVQQVLLHRHLRALVSCLMEDLEEQGREKIMRKKKREKRRETRSFLSHGMQTPFGMLVRDKYKEFLWKLKDLFNLILE